MIVRKNNSASLFYFSSLLLLLLVDLSSGDKNPLVIQGISVQQEEDLSQLFAEARSFPGENEDQVAIESRIVESTADSRDGSGGHHHHHGGGGHNHHGSGNSNNDSPTSFDSFSAPNAPAPQVTYSNEPPPPPPAGAISQGPNIIIQAAPAPDNVDSYGSPQAPIVTEGDSYGSPQAPIVSGGGSDSYGSPQAPIVNNGGGDSYGSPSGQVISGPPPPAPINQRPIPVPLPVPPQYKPRPQPPKRPSYRPPPPHKKRPHPPPKPQYKPQPRPHPHPKPQHKPHYKPRPKPNFNKGPKPSYKQPKRPSYNPPPQYKPAPQPKPQYKPAPQPPKPVYKPAPPNYNNAVAPPAIVTNEVESWPKAQPEMPKIVSLDVTCEKNLMKVHIEFDKPFYGIIFSKGHYSDVNCVHLPAGLGRTKANFDVTDSGSGTYFENTIVVQYDPQVQEVWDQARKLRCTWHDQYEKSVTFRPFAVDMFDVVRADFAGDNVGCWMQIQVGKGPWASEVSGLVKIGQTMTMVLAIKDDEQKFDMMLVDQKGCVTRPKLMSRFTKIKNFGASASVLSYAHFQAFKFPDSMEVHFQCTIQICRYQCPDQCGNDVIQAPAGENNDQYGSPVAPVQNVYSSSSSARAAVPPLPPLKKEKKIVEIVNKDDEVEIDLSDIGVQKVIQVVSTNDLTFAIKENEDEAEQEYPPVTQSLTDEQGYICMSTPAFAATLVILLAILVISCLLSAFLCLRHRSYYGESSLIAAFSNPVPRHLSAQLV
ncbi:unnamed protein product [Lepeophtheirus salmonis]|uniref:(salmon louse) hypothetical protein n=1 Tax=Lepeophtheirus salmonis TaxID=72036 RepID=A0A7R8CX22_LEPSM|nr:unnamed protein product [Lepeophtheirus salmonis]CAF2926690.1 unnamed protein product [Lepeophtheirus salmonis]